MTMPHSLIRKNVVDTFYTVYQANVHFGDNLDIDCRYFVDEDGEVNLTEANICGRWIEARGFLHDDAIHCAEADIALQLAEVE